MANNTWKNGTEAIGIGAIVVTLIVLIIEVRENTASIDRQASVDRISAATEPFFDAELASILVKIKSIDGEDTSAVNAYVENYGLSHEEAVLWTRHLWYLWKTLEAEYVSSGESEALDDQISLLLLSRDNQIFLEGARTLLFVDDFANHVAQLEQNLDHWKFKNLPTN